MRRRILYAVAALGALVLLLAAIVHSPPVRRYALARAQAALEGAGITARFGSLDYNLLTRRFTVRDVRLAARDRPNEPFVEAKRLEAVLEGLPGLRPFRLRVVEGDGLRVSLVRGADGRLNWPSGRRGGGGPPSTAWTVPDTIALRNTTFTYRGEGFSVEVPDATWIARRGLRGLEGGLVSDGFVTLRWPARALTLTDLRGLVRWDGTNVSVSAVRARAISGAPARGFARARGSTPPALGAATGAADMASLRANVEVTNVFGNSALTAGAEGTLNAGVALGWLRLPVDVSGPGRWTARVAGPTNALVTNATLTSSELVAYGIPRVSVTSNVRYANGVLHVDQASGSARGGEFDAHGTIAIANADAASRLEASWKGMPFTSALDAASLPRIGRLDADLAGQLNARWTGADDSLDLTIDNDARPAPARSPVAMTGRTRAHLRGGRWTIDHEHRIGAVDVSGTAIVAPPARATASSSLGGPLHARTGDLAAALQDLRRLDLLGRDVAEMVQAGAMDFEGRLGGAPAHPIVTGTARGAAVQPPGGAVMDVLADIRVTRTALEILSGSITQGDNRLNAAGSIGYARGDLNASGDAEIVDFAEMWLAAGWPAEWQPRGRARATFRIGGRLRQPQVDGEVRGDLGVSSLDPVPVTARVHVDNRSLAVSALRAEHPAGVLTGSGSIEPTARNRPFTVSVAGDVQAAERLAQAFPPGQWPLSGTFRLHATATGRLTDLAATSIDATVDEVNGRVWDTPIEVIAPARIVREGDRVDITNLRVRTGGSAAIVNGTLGPGAGGLVIDAAGRLEDFAHLVRASHPATDPLRGAFRATARVSGPLSRPTLEATVNGEEIAATLARAPELTNTTLAASLRDGAFSVERLTGAWAGAPFQVTASMPWRLLEPFLPERARGLVASPAGAAHVEFDVRGLTPEALAPFVEPETLANLGGRLSVRLTADADALRPEAVRGTLLLDEADILVSQVPLRQLEPTRFSIANGRLRVETLNWRGPGTQITAVGGVNWNHGSPRWDVAVDANMNLRMASVFLRPASTGGRADISVSFAGPLREPLVEGRVLLQNAEFRLRDPRLAATDITGAVLLTGDTVRLEAVQGSLNGGTLTAGGVAQLEGWTLNTMKVNVAVNEAAVEYPQGLRTEIAADLQLTKTADAELPLISGTITALRGGYNEQFAVFERLFAGSQTSVTIAQAPRDLGRLGQIRLDIGLATLEDIYVDTNLGRVEAGGSVRLRGSIDEPTLDGRISVRSGGQIFLGGTTYRVESGSIDVRGQRPIEPQLDLLAQTRVGTYSIRLRVSGTPSTLTADLTSDPVLDQSDIVSLLVTGRTIREGGLSTHVMGEQVLGYLSGDLLNFAGRAFGIDSVRIDRGLASEGVRFDPTLIATETDPASRLTISENLTRDIEIVLSQNLSGSGELAWMATWRPRRSIALRVISLENTDRTLEFRQELSFGGGNGPQARPSPERAAGPRVTGVTINGAGEHTNALRSRLKLTPGDRFDFYRWQDDRERILAYYHGIGHFEAEISARRRDTKNEEGAPAVELVYQVRPRARGEIVTQGVELSDAVMQAIRTEWTRSVFDGFLEEDVTTIVREALAREGYLRAEVKATVDASGERGARQKVLRIEAVPGPLTTDARIEWSGNTAIDSARLDAAIDKAGLRQIIWQEPARLEPVVRELYVAEGYLAGGAVAGTPEFDNGRARLPVKVIEGPQAVLGTVTYEGLRAASASELARAHGVKTGEPVRPAMLGKARAAMERFYRARGFNAVRVEVSATSEPEGAVHAVVRVDEGPRQVLANVEVTGGEHTYRGLVTRALQLRPGEPLDPEELYEARRRLYETGAFRQVDVQTEPAGSADTEEATGVPQQPMTAHVVLQEWPLWRFRYGLQVNSTLDTVTDQREFGPGLAADLERTNLFGRAVSVGMAVQGERDRQALRGYLSARRFLNLPIESTAFVQQTWEEFGPADSQTRTSITFEQRYRRQRTLQVNYGYFYQRNRWETLVEFGGSEPVLVVLPPTRYSGLFSAVALDRRDNPFDTQRGWFHSTSFRYASKLLGSDIRFVKTVLQQSAYVPLWRGLVFASNARLGLADGIGQEINIDERFFAGGGASVRGYEEDSLSPLDVRGIHLGGEALVVLNQELRFPIRNRLRGVAFLDAGNAFAEPSRIDLGDLGVGAGLGLRVVTPIGVVRLDYGWPVNEWGGATKGRWHFSLGQVF